MGRGESKPSRITLDQIFESRNIASFRSPLSVITDVRPVHVRGGDLMRTERRDLWGELSDREGPAITEYSAASDGRKNLWVEWASAAEDGLTKSVLTTSKDGRLDRQQIEYADGSVRNRYFSKSGLATMEQVHLDEGGIWYVRFSAEDEQETPGHVCFRQVDADVGEEIPRHQFISADLSERKGGIVVSRVLVQERVAGKEPNIKVYRKLYDDSMVLYRTAKNGRQIKADHVRAVVRNGALELELRKRDIIRPLLEQHHKQFGRLFRSDVLGKLPDAPTMADLAKFPDTPKEFFV